MKMDKSLINRTNWPEAIQSVLYVARKSRAPLIVVRGDNPDRMEAMKKYLVKRKAALVRIGITCTVKLVYSEIASQLTTESIVIPSEKAKNYIRRKLSSDCDLRYLIIDNCHRLGPRLLFFLLGFALEIEHRVKSIFMFEENNFSKYCEKNKKDKRFKFVTNFTKLIRALPA